MSLGFLVWDGLISSMGGFVAAKSAARILADTAAYGPAMGALPEKQQGFVLAKVDNPLIDDWKAAEVAGYGGGRGGKPEGRRAVLGQIGYKLAHDDRIIAAIREQVGKRMRHGGMLGVANLIAIATNPEHRDFYRASEALMNREFGVVTQKIEVDHTHTDRSPAVLVEGIMRAALVLGLDVEAVKAKLIGGNAEAAAMKTIEHETTKAGANEAGDNSDR